MNENFSSLDIVMNEVYTKFKLYYYQRIFRKIGNGAEGDLTAIETFSVEAINCLQLPTLSEFAAFINVSEPNAAYKVMKMQQKGYIEKLRSKKDSRVTLLKVTEKFERLHGTSQRYASVIAKRLIRRFSESELKTFQNVLQVISTDLMKEVNNYLKKGNVSFHSSLPVTTERWDCIEN